MDPLDLALSVSPATGVRKRLGPDEPVVGDVPQGLSFSTSDPGLFKTASLGLSRTLDDLSPELRLFADVHIYGLGNRTAWEGRLQEMPHEHGDTISVNPNAVGHAAALDDDPSFAEIYIDADLNKWGEASVARRQQLYSSGMRLTASTSIGVSPLEVAAIRAGIVNDFTALNANTEVDDMGEMHYYSGGPEIGSIQYEYGQISAFAKDTVGWETTMVAGTTDTFPVFTAGPNLGRASALEQNLLVAAGMRYARVRDRHIHGAYAGKLGDVVVWRPKVIGRHGVAIRGTFPNIGLYGSDVVADIVKRCAPGLNFTTGQDGSIEPSTYVIPHLDFSEPSKGSDRIMGVNAYHQRSWGVEDGKRFFWRSAEKVRKRWRIRRSLGHRINLLGPQAEDAFNGVVVTYTDPSGQTRVITPPGVSSAFATSPLLLDTSVSNPVNQAGIARKWAELQLGFVTDAAGAVQVAAAWLRDKVANVNSRGSVTVSGMVEDDETGALYPCWYMRAGDSAIVTDGDNIERRIIETNYEHDSRSNTCNLDATPHRIEALMERMGLALVGIVD